MISIPHIKMIEEKNEVKENFPQLPELTPLEHAEAQKRLDEIRASLSKKLKVSNASN